MTIKKGENLHMTKKIISLFISIIIISISIMSFATSSQELSDKISELEQNISDAQGKIGREGTNYAEFVKGCTPKEAYKKLASKHNYSNYSGYPDNHQACASNTLNASWTNCGDRARLLKACMDVLGQPCVIYHVYNHYMNGILINGRWETVDLCYQSGSMPQYQTAGWNR